MIEVDEEGLKKNKDTNMQFIEESNSRCLQFEINEFIAFAEEF